MSDLTIDFGYVCPVICVDDKFGGTLTTSILPNGNLQIVFDQFTTFNDNSYGANSVGWGGPNGHKFSNLTGSDKANFVVNNAAGQKVLDFTVDYLTCGAAIQTPSQCASLGVSGGDGGIQTGNANLIVSATTSLAENLNKLGFCNNGNCTVGNVDLKVDSPPTAAPDDYTLPAGSPFTGWNFANRYVVEVSKDAAPGGFGEVTVPLVHNSPAKPNASCVSTADGLCAAKTKLGSLTVKYTGQGCSASQNSQAADKWNCSGGEQPDQRSGAAGRAGEGGQGRRDVRPEGEEVPRPDGQSEPGGHDLRQPDRRERAEGRHLLRDLLQHGRCCSGQFHTSCSQPIAVGTSSGPSAPREARTSRSKADSTT